MVAHDVGVRTDIGGARRVARQAREISEATHLIDNAFAGEILRDGDCVAGVLRLDQLGNCRVDQLVVAAVEVR